MIHFNDGSTKGPLDFDIFFVCMPKVIFIASMEVSMLPKWCRLRYPTPPVHPDGPRTKWTHIDDQQVPCREYLPPVGETEPTMPGGGPCELIEASRLARLLKEASPLNGFADHDCSGEKMTGQSIWQPLRAFHGNVGADPILGHLMALHFISWAFH